MAGRGGVCGVLCTLPTLPSPLGKGEMCPFSSKRNVMHGPLGLITHWSGCIYIEHFTL